MIIVTGGAGFIGSNIIKGLNERGYKNILAVDNLTNGVKFHNLADLHIDDYMDKDVFLQKIFKGENFSAPVEAIFHEGACSATTEWNGKYMMDNNYEFSKRLLHYCQERQIAFMYASSAATYGAGAEFVEDPNNEKPLNVYGYSKFLFDQYVRRLLPKATTQIVGCRYFNVYGPREQHKGSMASVAFHLHGQLSNKENTTVKLFEGTEGYANGEQLRDFVYVGDVVKANLWFLDNPQVKGIFNVGSGRAESFNAVARAVIDWHQRGKIEYIPFPDHLKGRYQNFTEANLSLLRQAGYTGKFLSVAEGVKAYLDELSTMQK